MPNKNILNHKIPIAHNYSGFTQMWIMMTVWCLGLNSYSLPSHCFTWLGWKDVGRNLKETCYCLLDFWVYPLKKRNFKLIVYWGTCDCWNKFIMHASICFSNQIIVVTSLKVSVRSADCNTLKATKPEHFSCCYSCICRQPECC